MLKLNLTGATPKNLPVYENGMIRSVKCYQRGHHQLPLTGTFEAIVELLGHFRRRHALPLDPGRRGGALPARRGRGRESSTTSRPIEGMLSEGWLHASFDPSKPKLTLNTPEEGRLIHKNRDVLPNSGAS